MRLTRRLRLPAAAALAASALLPAAAPAATCSFDAATARVGVDYSATGAAARIDRTAAGAIRLDGAPCGTATVTNTDTIVATGGNGVQTLVVDLAGGRLAPGKTVEAGQISEIEVLVDGSAGGEFPNADIVRVTGSAVADVLRIDGTGFLTNGDADPDVTTTGVEALGVAGGGGNDQLLGAAAGRPLTLEGGSGDDVLEGGAWEDTLDGGPDDDVERGNGDKDAFRQGATPNGSDVLDGGGSPYDLIDYSARTTDVRIDLDDVADDGAAGELDDVRDSFEYVEGGAGADTIVASQARYQTFDLKGNEGADTVTGGTNYDYLDGGPGADVLTGGDMGDSFTGGSGDDRMSGGEGMDVFREGDEAGPTGADDIRGGNGVDKYSARSREAALTIRLDDVANDGEAGEGDNVRSDVEDVEAGRGDDVIAGTSATNYVDGNRGADTVTGGGGADEIYGYQGEDRLDGGPDADILYGGDEADRLTGGTGTDNVYGDYGADVFVEPAAADGPDRLVGGYDADRVSYAARTTPVTVTLDSLNDDGATGEKDWVDAEGVTGGGGADQLDGSPGDNRLEGGGGADRLSGFDGKDTLVGGAGGDAMTGGGGTDTADYSAAAFNLVVTLDGAANDGVANERDNVSAERVVGGRGFDRLTGDAGVNELDGGPGNDTLDGGTGGDVLTGAEGTDTVSYATRTGSVVVTLDGEGFEGADTNADGRADEQDRVSTTIENLTGGGGADRLTGGPGANTLTGGGGDDRLDGGAGPDALVGGLGRDVADYGARSDALAITLDGVAGDGATGEGDNVATEVVEGGDAGDRLTGGPAAEELRGNGGPDVLSGGAGADVLAGGVDADTVTYAERPAEQRVLATLDGLANDGAANERDNVQTDVENLTGGAGDDDLRGDDDSNAFSGGPGNDSLSGRGGDDRFDAGAVAGTPGTDGDHFFGGEGRDVVDYSKRRVGLRISLDHIDDDGVPAGPGVPKEGDTVHPDVEDVLGGAYGDIITGTDAPNAFDGGHGNDILEGRGGDDALRGGGLRDRLRGEAGNDTLEGGPGDNTYEGGEGNDRFVESPTMLGKDTFTGGAGRDSVDYSARDKIVQLDNDGERTDGEAKDPNAEPHEGDQIGADIEILIGGDGWDTLINRHDFGDTCSALVGNGGNDHLLGTDADEYLLGGWGIDRIRAEDGDDVLAGGPMNDIEEGEGGDDRFIQGDVPEPCVPEFEPIAGGDGEDAILGDSGSDRVSYVRNASTPVLIELDGNTGSNGAAGEGDDFRGIDHGSGGEGDDTLIGNGADNELFGNRGDDRVEGRDGDDKLYGHYGVDVLLGEGDDDELHADDGAGGDTADGGDGTDKAWSDDGDTLIKVP